MNNNNNNINRSGWSDRILTPRLNNNSNTQEPQQAQRSRNEEEGTEQVQPQEEQQQQHLGINIPNVGGRARRRRLRRLAAARRRHQPSPPPPPGMTRAEARAVTEMSLRRRQELHARERLMYDDMENLPPTMVREISQNVSFYVDILGDPEEGGEVFDLTGHPVTRDRLIVRGDRHWFRFGPSESMSSVAAGPLRERDVVVEMAPNHNDDIYSDDSNDNTGVAFLEPGYMSNLSGQGFLEEWGAEPAEVGHVTDAESGSLEHATGGNSPTNVSDSSRPEGVGSDEWSQYRRWAIQSAILPAFATSGLPGTSQGFMGNSSSAASDPYPSNTSSSSSLPSPPPNSPTVNTPPGSPPAVPNTSFSSLSPQSSDFSCDCHCSECCYFLRIHAQHDPQPQRQVSQVLLPVAPPVQPPVLVVSPSAQTQRRSRTSSFSSSVMDNEIQSPDSDFTRTFEEEEEEERARQVNVITRGTALEAVEALRVEPHASPSPPPLHSPQ